MVRSAKTWARRRSLGLKGDVLTCEPWDIGSFPGGVISRLGSLSSEELSARESEYLLSEILSLASSSSAIAPALD